MSDDLETALASLAERRRVIDALAVFGDHDDADVAAWFLVRRYHTELERQALAAWRIH
jgi:hypothetical protein